jgi:putative addiction module component (TIGR02574 family)
MTEAALRLRETLMGLPEADRAWLAAELAASLDGRPEAAADEAWDTEIERRAAEVKAGTASLIGWDAVSLRLDQRLSKP